MNNSQIKYVSWRIRKIASRQARRTLSARCAQYADMTEKVFKDKRESSDQRSTYPSQDARTVQTLKYGRVGRKLGSKNRIPYWMEPIVSIIKV